LKLVGLRELKARLSGIISEVRAGQQIIITDHGQEVARISPISHEYRTMQLLCETGKAQWNGGRPEGAGRRIEVKGEPLSATILGERE